MRLSVLSSVSLLALVLAAAPAQAAFEFVAPKVGTRAKASAAPAEAAVPVISNTAIESTDLDAPVNGVPVRELPPLPAEPKEMVQPQPMPMPLTPVKAGPVPLTPIAHGSDALVIENRAPSMAMPADKPALAPVMPAEYQQVSTGLNDASVVQGFGRDVPLVLALQQIVPPNYRYSFGSGVNPGMRVSWTGGHSWKGVIMELAQSHDLDVDIVSNVVAFRGKSAGSAPLMPIAVPSPVAGEPMPLAMPVKSAPVAPVMKAEQSLPPIIDEPAPAPAPAPVVTPVAAKGDDKAMHDKLASARKEAAFDPLMDTNKPAKSHVENKQILTADDEASAMMSSSAMQDVALQPLMPEMPASAPAAAKNTLAADLDNTPAPTAAPLAPVPPPITSTETIMPAPVMEPAPLPVVPPQMPPQMMAAAPMMPAMAMPPVSNVVSDMTTPTEWRAAKGMTLRQTLTDWAARAGVSLVWSSEYDYPLQTDVRIDAGFADAAKTLLAGFSKATPRPLGRLFNNKQVGAQPVLIVETQALAN